MDTSGIREVTQDNVTLQDVFEMLCMHHMRLVRLECVVVDLLTVVLGSEDLSETEKVTITNNAARFFTEVGDESTATRELRNVVAFLHSPE